MLQAALNLDAAKLLPTPYLIANLGKMVSNFYSDYDNRIYTEIDIKDPLLLAKTHLSLVECTSEAIDTMLEEEKAKKKS